MDMWPPAPFSFTLVADHTLGQSALGGRRNPFFPFSSARAPFSANG